MATYTTPRASSWAVRITARWSSAQPFLSREEVFNPLDVTLGIYINGQGYGTAGESLGAYK
jgi:hypothetical protein